MQVSTTLITPQLAASLIASNPNNRPVAESRVRTLAAIMRAGKWEQNGETIIISQSGKLLDGQHRLQGLIEYGRPIEFMVATGVPDAAFTTIDTGQSRGNGVIMGLAGIKNPYVSAAAAGILWRMFHSLSVFQRIPPNYAIQVIQRYPSMEKWASGCSGVGVAMVMSPSPLTAALVYLEDIAKRPVLAQQLWDGLTTGAGLNEGSPILALRNRIINMRAKKQKIHLAASWNAVCSAISALEGGRTLAKIRAPATHGKIETPDLFWNHAERLSLDQQLKDLLPPIRKEKDKA